MLARKWTLATAVMLGLSVQAWAQEPDTLEIVKKVDEATKKVTAFAYECKSYGTGAFADQAPKIEGKCIAKLADKRGGPEMIYFEGKTDPDASTKLHDQMAFDGKTGIRIDHINKRVTTGGANLVQAGRQFLYMQEFFHPTPFTDEINADKRTYKGKQKIGDTECHVIELVYSGGQGEAVWYFGVEDNLPHRVDRIIDQDGQRGARVLELLTLNTSPEITDATFKPAAPEGYEKREAAAGAPAAARGPLAAGAAAPDFELATTAGEKVKLADGKDNVIVLVFWNTFTRSCVDALKATDKMAADLSGKPVKFYAVNAFDDESADVQGYWTKHELKTTALLKGDATARSYQVRGCPYFYVIGKDGKIVAAAQGADAATKAAESIAKALE